MLQQERYGRESTVEARLDGNTVTVETHNVRRIEIGPLPDLGTATVKLDATTFDNVKIQDARQFVRATDGQWSQIDTPMS